MSKQLITILGLAGVSLAAIQSILIPQTPEDLVDINAEGNAKDNRIFGDIPMSGQDLIMQHALTYLNQGKQGLLPGQVIKSFTVRTDSETQADSPVQDVVFDDFKLGFSTNSLPDTASMSTTFADNRGSDFAWVAGGPLTIPTNYFPGDGKTTRGNNFPATFIPFDRPWGYSGGNLVIDLTHNGFISGDATPANLLSIDLHGQENDYKTLVGPVKDSTIGGFESKPHQSIIMLLEVYDSPEWNCVGSGTLYCYDSDPACQAGNEIASIPLTNGALFSDAVNLCLDADPTSLCAKCGDTGKCFALLTGDSKSVGDPHFVGFDGSRFDFFGEDGRVFNIISDVNFQLNSLFKEMTVQGSDGTWMTEIGVMYGNNTLIYSPIRGILVNENVVLRVGETKAFNEMIVRADNAKRIFIETPEYNIKIDVAGTDNLYLNLEVSMTRLPVDPHGILGQTARNMLNKETTGIHVGKGRVLDGEESDYVVRDGLLGSDFTFNRFQSIELPLNTKRGTVNLVSRAILP